MKQQELFIPYELALICKEKGFDEECLAYYRMDAPIHQKDKIYEFITVHDYDQVKKDKYMEVLFAPLYQQVVDWIREKYNLHIGISQDWDKGKLLGYEGLIESTNGETVICTDTFDYYSALIAAITEALKLI